MFQVIVACTENGGIGWKGKLPWYIPDDLHFFAEQTAESVIIMGRKTWESLPKKLANRINVVVSSKPSVVRNPDYVCSTLDLALAYARKRYPNKQVYVIGGSQLYQEALEHPDCRRVFLTKVYNDVDCDAYFPLDTLQKNFRKVVCSMHLFYPPYMYNFNEYEKDP